MVENTGLDIHSNSNFKTLDADVNELHKKLDEMENISYVKLTELRQKNDKLNILEHHIDNITRENEEITKKITQREFNLLE